MPVDYTTRHRSGLLFPLLDKCLLYHRFHQVPLWYLRRRCNASQTRLCDLATTPAICLVSINTPINITLIIIIRQQALGERPLNTFWSLFPSKLTLPWTKTLPRTHCEPHTHTHTSPTTDLLHCGALGCKWENFYGSGGWTNSPPPHFKSLSDML